MNRKIRDISQSGSVLIAIAFFVTQNAFAAEIETSGKITSVTVFLDQARVVREIPIEGSDELQKIRVTGLPRQLLQNSAYTESDPGVTIQSMQVLSRLVPSSDKSQLSDDAKKLTEKQKELNKRIQDAENQLTIIQQDLETLEKMVDFSAAQAKQNLDRATLDVESVTKLADFAIERRRKLAAEMFTAENELEQLKKDLEENQQQQAAFRAYQAKPTLEAVMTVLSKDGGVVRLMYDVTNVNWTPQYSIRATTGQGDGPTFEMQLDALVYQESGEAWDGVQLAIATRLPDAQAARPVLTPLRVQAVEENQTASNGGLGGALVRNSPAQTSWIDPELLQRNLQLNATASRRQVTELTRAAEVQREIAEDAVVNLMDETYRIAQPVTVGSRPQLQTVNIVNSRMKGDLHRIVTPLLSSFAFREASLTNESGLNLVSGNAKVYLDGKYVGKTILPPTAAGQRMTVGFGTDRKLRSRRELLTRDESIQGGNRQTTLTYRLVISNYHDDVIPVRLIDRIPVAAKDGSISVALGDASAKTLSEDKLYRRMQFPTGVLRWDLDIPAKKFGSEAFDHEYQYSVEMDRQKTIVSNDLSRMVGDLQFEKSNMGGGMGGGGAF